jgi:hypothetical protein
MSDQALKVFLASARQQPTSCTTSPKDAGRPVGAKKLVFTPGADPVQSIKDRIGTTVDSHEQKIVVDFLQTNSFGPSRDSQILALVEVSALCGETARKYEALQAARASQARNESALKRIDFSLTSGLEYWATRWRKAADEKRTLGDFSTARAFEHRASTLLLSRPTKEREKQSLQVQIAQDAEVISRLSEGLNLQEAEAYRD